MRTFDHTSLGDRDAHEVKLLILKRETFKATIKGSSGCQGKTIGMGGCLTSCLESTSLFGLTLTDRGPDEAGRYRTLDDDESDQNWEVEIAAREEVLTNEMTILPPPRAGHDP